jgi:hypothetical protein
MAARPFGSHPYSHLWADCLENVGDRPLTPLWASMACYKDSFTLPFLSLLQPRALPLQDTNMNINTSQVRRVSTNIGMYKCRNNSAVFSPPCLIIYRSRISALTIKCVSLFPLQIFSELRLRFAQKCMRFFYMWSVPYFCMVLTKFALCLQMSVDERKLLNEELHNLYSSPNIIRMINSRRMR